ACATFELRLARTFREELRESLYRMVAVLTGMGITLMLTAELEDSYVDLRLPARDGLPDRRNHHATLHRVEGSAPTCHGGGESARQCAQQRAARLRNH